MIGVQLLCFLAVGPIEAASTPLGVRVTLPPPPRYAGQPLDLRVTVVGPALVKLIPPESPDFLLIPGSKEMRPLVLDAIGNQVRESVASVFPFTIVPRRAGKIRIGPFRAEASERSGASSPTEIDVRTPPPAGRPLGFLGGVGRLELAARLDPTTTGPGRAVRLEVILSGDGAHGSTTRPDIRPAPSDEASLQVEPDGERFTADPPRRVWGYRVRASRAGQGRLAPLVVATFDPISGRYESSSLASQVVRVVQAPALAPDVVELPEVSEAVSWWDYGWLVTSCLVAIIAMLTWSIWLHARSKRNASKWQARRLASRLRQVKDGELAAESVDSLIAYLAVSTGRAAGAIGPDEASKLIEQATGSGDLASEAAGLVMEADRIRFGQQSSVEAGFRAKVILFFERLAR